MAFTISLCPFCGGDVSPSDEPGSLVCGECGKHTFRSRSNSKAFLNGKPYGDSYSAVLDEIDSDPEDALGMIEEIISGSETPNADMFFVRGMVYAHLGEDGKARNDWKKGLELLSDMRFIDGYIIAVCRCITDLICYKEEEFIEFDYISYIDEISTEFGVKSGVPVKGIFFITIYRNLRIQVQSGEIDADEDIYTDVIPKLIEKILSYGRNYKTNCNIVEEVLEDLKYDPETFIEDDNQRMHLWDSIRMDITELSENFSDEHFVRVFRHWNDENMFDLEYWLNDLMKSVKDVTILQGLRKFKNVEDDADIYKTVEEYARKYLLLSDEGADLSDQS